MSKLHDQMCQFDKILGDGHILAVIKRMTYTNNCICRTIIGTWRYNIQWYDNINRPRANYPCNWEILRMTLSDACCIVSRYLAHFFLFLDQYHIRHSFNESVSSFVIWIVVHAESMMTFFFITGPYDLYFWNICINK